MCGDLISAVSLAKLNRIPVTYDLMCELFSTGQWNLVQWDFFSPTFYY